MSQLFFKTLDFLNKDRPFEKNEKEKLSLHFLAVLTTALLMWSYAANSFFTVNNTYGIKYWGIVYAMIHLISPLIYRYTRSLTFSTYSFLFAGYFFQLHHTISNGGYLFSTSSWFSILPLIAGIVLGKFHIIIWAVISLSTVFVLLYLEVNGVNFPTSDYNSQIWSQINISVGYIILNCILVGAYIWFRGEYERALEEKNNKIKTLIRILIHDINNPLTIISLANMKLKLDDPSNPMVDKISSGLENIKDIINSVRELQVLESNKQELKITKIDLEQTVKDSLCLFETSLLNKNINILFECDCRYQISADRALLQNQVLNNLISNAIKFSKKDSTIYISIIEFQENVIFKIKDEGIGIPKDLISKLFDSDIKTNRKGTQGEKGTGFGLSIVKSVLEKLDANIVVHSEENKGSEFKILFPKKG